MFVVREKPSMDVAHEPGRFISRNIDCEIDTFISRRHEQRVATEGERRDAESWRASVRRYNEAHHRDLCYQWIEYHQHSLTSRERTKAILDANDRQEIERYQTLLTRSSSLEEPRA